VNYSAIETGTDLVLVANLANSNIRYFNSAFNSSVQLSGKLLINKQFFDSPANRSIQELNLHPGLAFNFLCVENAHDGRANC
jgi:hypothetical protein